MIRLPLVLALAGIVTSGCAAPPQTVRPGDLDHARKVLDSLDDYVVPSEFKKHYLDALVASLQVRTGEEELTLVLFKPPGWFCGHGVRDGGMEAPAGLQDQSVATRMVAFDERGRPLYQISCTPWADFALLDADGDPTTTELAIWSDRREYLTPAFLKIFRLTRAGCQPLLELILNPSSVKARFKSEHHTNEDGSTTTWFHEIHELARRGRWRFEGTAVVIEEKADSGAFAVAARFEFDPAAGAWSGPAGGPSELWQVGGEPWIQSGFVSVAELEPHEKLTGAGFGSLRKDVDHLKAAKEAAREAGLTD